MKKTNTKDYNEALKEYLTPIFISKMEDYDVTTLNPFTWAVECAKKELPHVFKRKGLQACVLEWVSGCALDIEIYNSDIISKYEKLHGYTLTEKQKEWCIDNWFNHIAFKIVSFANKEDKNK
jgi:hypothetical protein